MSSLLRFALILALLLSAFAVPGLAAEEEPTEPGDDEEVDEGPEPIDMTLFLHGRETVGELEIPNGLLEGYMSMDEEEPTADFPKSMMVTNYVAGPNPRCSGNWLVPTWSTWFEGTLVDDLTVTLHTLAPPGAEIEVRLYADAGDIACNDDYVEAIASKTVAVEPGLNETEVVFEGLDVQVMERLILTVYAHDTNQARLFYDAADFASNVQLSCVPVEEGLDTCVW
jgi:hypothetical protein